VTAPEDGGSLRRSDIVAINKGRDYGLIIDPTIRLEINESQPQDVHEEKQAYIPKPSPIIRKNIIYQNSKFTVSSLAQERPYQNKFKHFGKNLIWKIICYICYPLRP
jgi:hypothetical protein